MYLWASATNIPLLKELVVILNPVIYKHSAPPELRLSWRENQPFAPEPAGSSLMEKTD